tara:strand:- start:323 stop:607 length:285 start_codon:yes stop_codon:yes gene_type:complete
MPYGKSNKQIADSHMKKTSGFKMKGWSAFTKTNVDSENKQKMFSKKASDLRQAWRSIKDPNSNRANQLKQEAKSIGLTLEENTSPRGLNVDEVD